VEKIYLNFLDGVKGNEDNCLGTSLVIRASFTKRKSRGFRPGFHEAVSISDAL
jgi:hypothetical protein